MPERNKGKIIAIIPARGGSKGIHRKNIQILGGKPLIAWTIEAAKMSRVVDRIIVSTEDEEIAEVAREWGGEVPFFRPVEMARDDSSAGEAVCHAQSRLIKAGENVAVTMVLYPTHPFRTRHMFKAAVSALLDHKCDTFTTVRKINTPPGKFVGLNRQGYIYPLSLPGAPQVHYRPYGLITATRRHHLNRGTYVYPVSDLASLVDIDEPEDLKYAEAVLNAGFVDYYG
ncbi:MAG: acylneuraminate cytidylyltransferase family protein [Desulfobacter sp.]|nr:MAG: acylneuraminate cytidylyltransferase family protein [Desulfobacter sp.]